MVRFCCVPYCTTKSIYTKGYDPNIKFHEFPADLKVREKWLKLIERGNDFVPKDWACVCSMHFDESDYKTGLKRRLLKPGSVPSLFPNSLQPVERRSKRASPEKIANYKRKKVCSSQTNSNSSEIQKSEDSEDQVLYEIIAINEPPLDNAVHISKPKMQEASTQADGLWDKINNLYKINQSLKRELQNKTAMIATLTKQNKKLVAKLTRLESDNVKKKEAGKISTPETVRGTRELVVCSPNVETAYSKPSSKVRKPNNENKTTDLSSYFHPRIPRSLCPPNYNGPGIHKRKVVLSVNHLNQVTVSDPSCVPEQYPSSDKEIFTSPLIHSVPKYITERVVKDEQLDMWRICSQMETRADDETCNVTNITCDEEDTKLVMSEVDSKHEENDFPADNDYLVVPENYIIENRGDEIIIYSAEEV